MLSDSMPPYRGVYNYYVFILYMYMYIYIHTHNYIGTFFFFFDAGSMPPRLPNMD